MKKNVILILSAIILGLYMGNNFLSQYKGNQNKKESIQVSTQTETLYFLQAGVYSNLDNVKKNSEKFKYYIYKQENDLYFVFIGITKNSDNANKLKDYYNSLGYDIYVKEYDVTNVAFLEVLDQYDQLLSQTADSETYETLCSHILGKYEELVLNDENEGNTN